MPGLSSGIPADSPSGDAEGDSYSRSGIQSRLFHISMTNPPATSWQAKDCPATRRQERSRRG
ncbi:MAG TPA: hypothetical protein VKZ46_02015 [Pedomonas sp.]|nr:hypothetical protein [Pedomonas sp.]